METRRAAREERNRRAEEDSLRAQKALELAHSVKANRQNPGENSPAVTHPPHHPSHSSPSHSPPSHSPLSHSPANPPSHSQAHPPSHSVDPPGHSHSQSVSHSPVDPPSHSHAHSVSHPSGQHGGHQPHSHADPAAQVPSAESEDAEINPLLDENEPIEEFHEDTMQTPEFARELLRRFLLHSDKEDHRVLTAGAVKEILYHSKTLLSHEANIVQVSCKRGGKITVVGDIHGQLHDLATLIDKAGYPDEKTGASFVFNGDFVDRGSWGVECFLLLLVWKLIWPHNVFLIRGNHETTYCTATYGFENEVKSKYHVSTYRSFVSVFRVLPLCAVIQSKTLVLHGGLFRNPRDPTRAGNLEDLSRVKRTDEDPQNNIAEDLLWSDPTPEPGLKKNETRGCGFLFGPDITNKFMADNNLRLIIRSHEGPDARKKRPEMQPMLEGHSIDQTVEAGILMTLFSAPNYPQFQPSDQERVVNKAAFVVLHSEKIYEPEIHQFEAVPRPSVQAFYDYECAIDSDAEQDR